MNDQSPSLTSDINFPPGFDSLPRKEREKVHRRNIQAILPRQGTEGAERYKKRYPEAAQVRYQLGNPRAYLPKPAGYTAAIASMVEHWFNSRTACAETNTADVKRLNAKLESSFVPTNHFNTSLSPARKERLAKVFADNGSHYDRTRLNTLSQVREAVKAAHREADPDTKPFGNIGRRKGNKLLLAGQEYTITKHGSHECIRPRINGAKRRLHLDDLLWMAGLLQADDTPGEHSPTLRSNYIARAHSGNDAPPQGSSLTGPGPSADDAEESLIGPGPFDPLSSVSPDDIAALKAAATDA
ncbi:hypothetical protein [Erythrobacter rubeus]|uniref:Uncharacterized protein n=1 Tax=Erythrobacter rubeus TaxID=2760803 RepID=A0ABR8KQ48_9SPHN|nr:hypothetical protein [Erythrobacter rubeus]MBD2841507.1 hypothetical protein [Erythrobacter rubeus]